MSAAFDACSRRNWSLAEDLFDKDPQECFLFRDHQDFTILHEVVNLNGPLTFVRKLLMRGLNPNWQNALKRTPLHYALQPNHSIELLELLLSSGANPNAADKEGKTPVHWAALENVNIRMLQLLLLAGGDIDREDAVSRCYVVYIFVKLTF